MPYRQLASLAASLVRGARAQATPAPGVCPAATQNTFSSLRLSCQMDNGGDCVVKTGRHCNSRWVLMQAGYLVVTRGWYSPVPQQQ